MCVQVTHSITLLTLVHQNIYNSLTLLVSVLTRWKSDKGEEVGSGMVSRLRTMSSSSMTTPSNIVTTTVHPCDTTRSKWSKSTKVKSPIWNND